MFIYQIENSKVVSVGSGDGSSADPSALINRANAWAAASAGRSVIVQETRAKLPSGKSHRLDYLVVSGGVVEAMTPAEMAATDSAEQTKKDTERQNRKSRKQSIRTKLGLSKTDISALKELLEDGDDN